jgi:hypothetical protein
MAAPLAGGGQVRLRISNVQLFIAFFSRIFKRPLKGGIIPQLPLVPQ